MRVKIKYLLNGSYKMNNIIVAIKPMMQTIKKNHAHEGHATIFAVQVHKPQDVPLVQSKH